MEQNTQKPCLKLNYETRKIMRKNAWLYSNEIANVYIRNFFFKLFCGNKIMLAFLSITEH